MWVSLLVTHLGLWDWCTCPKSGFCCFWPCRKPPERQPFCERLPPGTSGPPLPSRMASGASSTWEENVYDDVEVPGSNKSQLYLQTRDGLTEVTYEPVPDHDHVETTISRDKEKRAASPDAKHSAAAPGAKSKGAADSTKRSPKSEDEHIYENIDAAHIN
ncbi:uncharacterized protein LOC142570462 [Dermacentor variabilis]|uniref:uncharacterized protein LOC142570462 n=1 Tax=Dermacentor variabilis TaxID=34621 RepID=UPI003F5C3448